MGGVHLTRKLTLEEASRAPDGAGGYSEAWTQLGTLWADVRAGSGSEAAQDFLMVSRVPFRVIVRAAPHGAPSRPKPEQRFRDGARVMRIVSVAEHDTGGRYLVCRAIEEEVSG
ncbi:head-tail adaptor protein [Aliiroseovarius sp. PTFE2010]|uniref:head-tail adaptor protein n=1 Tax=Aliiroseovarius sp. PTFE2010 TaxID=3417190 RepID=UPI003CF187F7